MPQARLVSSFFYGTQTKHVYLEFVGLHNQNTCLWTISVEMITMSKYGLSNNQSECLDLPQDYPAIK